MRPALRSFVRIATTLAVSLLAVAATAQTVLDSPELYAGEKALYEAAKKEGMVVSFDTGPTWANWAAEFAAFKKRYPEVEIVYNDIGSGATVAALDRRRPGCRVRRELRHGRRHEQPATGARLFCQAAPVGQRAARARHDAVRAVRQRRDSDLDLL